MTARRISMLPHDPIWARRFASEAARLLAVFAGGALSVHHVGSTAVPELEAKPILDVLLVARALADLDGARAAAEAADYTWLGPYGIDGRRFLTAQRHEEDADAYRVHVHAFAAGDPNVERHVDFRDYLLAHPRRAAAYGRLKRELAERFADDRASYTEAKTPFVQETEELARAWRRATARARDRR